MLHVKHSNVLTQREPPLRIPDIFNKAIGKTINTQHVLSQYRRDSPKTVLARQSLGSWNHYSPPDSQFLDDRERRHYRKAKRITEELNVIRDIQYKQIDLLEQFQTKILSIPSQRHSARQLVEFKKSAGKVLMDMTHCPGSGHPGTDNSVKKDDEQCMTRPGS
ncbi:hypothetical protein B0T21DRAFT_408821 [Apiosordaria backusii]|uniref:Uncharacterized protein n=1 Tax=Apiosordaria backusii TaxID=314023 RepID=A0AA40EMC9_9PEZI|nr:hypothetical protein B0T21DRAFT_408821 [Apiosordaria backusii]